MTDVKLRAHPAEPLADMVRAAIKSGAKVRTKLSTSLPADREALFRAIDAERAALRIPRLALALAAGVSAPHYERLCRVGGKSVTARLVTALLRGLRTARAGVANKPPETLAFGRAAYQGCLAHAAGAHGLPLDLVQAQLERKGEFNFDAAWVAASKVRSTALYLASVEVGIPATMLATLVGLTPAAISYALNRVEDRREDARFDAAVEEAALQVRGEL